MDSCACLIDGNGVKFVKAQGLKRAAVYDSGMHNVYYAQRLTNKNIKTVIVKIKKISPFVNDFARLFILPTRILKL